MNRRRVAKYRRSDRLLIPVVLRHSTLTEQILPSLRRARTIRDTGGAIDFIEK
jgi:hypothetical protein